VSVESVRLLDREKKRGRIWSRKTVHWHSFGGYGSRRGSGEDPKGSSYGRMVPIPGIGQSHKMRKRFIVKMGLQENAKRGGGGESTAL